MKKISIISIFLMIFLIGMLGGEWTEDLAVGVTRYYPLNESTGTNAEDVINGVDLTTRNMEEGDWAAGKIGNSLDFDGTNEYANGTVSNALNATADYTISLWVSSDASTGDGFIGNTISSTNRLSFGVLNSHFVYEHYNGTGVSDVGVYSASTFSTGTFYHIVVVHWANNSLVMYMNNVTNVSTGAGVSTHNTVGEFVLGQSSGVYGDGKLDEIGIWNRTLTQSEIDDLYNNGAGITFVRTVPDDSPTTTITFPPDEEVFVGEATQTITFNGSATDDMNLANISLYGNWSGGWHLNATNTSVINNTETKFTVSLPQSTYLWNYYSCDNASQCSFAAANRTFQTTTYINNGVTFNSTTLETATETFILNITTNGTAPTNGKLIYNGTSYAATVTNIAGDVYNISRTIDIPTTPENKPFIFNFTLSGLEQSVGTGIYNQTVNVTNFTFFTSGTPFINISFKNETLSEELVTATIDSDWYYWLGSGDVVKTLSFTNISENDYYTFLLVGVNRTLQTNTTITYSNSISQQRTYIDTDLDLTNTTTELTLYLLPTTEGVFVTFQVINVAEQPLAGVFSNVTTGGNLISSGTTDDSGAVAYFVDPDTTYTFTFSKEGYVVFTTTLSPTQTTYTITLSQTGAVITEDYTRGMNYSISPGISSLTNNTNTFFNFSLTSSYWTVNSFGFNLTNQDGTIVNASNATTNGGTVYVYHNTSNDTSLTMGFFWNVSGNITVGSFTWVVFDGSGTGFGLNNFFTRIKTYLSEEIYGLNTTSMVILIYFIIFVSVGIMSLKFGMTSPATVVMVLFGLSFLLEVHLELIPLVSGVPLLTTVIGTVVSIALIKEYLKI